MKVVNVRPRDICVTFEMSVQEIDLFIEYLDHCSVTYDPKKDKKMAEADEYMKKNFANLVELHSNLIKDIDGEN